jgi:hypothetical protein
MNPNYSVLIPDGETDFSLPVIMCLSQSVRIKAFVLSNHCLAALLFTYYKMLYKRLKIKSTRKNGAGS